MILLEDRIEFLKKQHAGGISTAHDTYAIHHKPEAIIDHFATHADPTRNKQYTQWIVNRYKEGTIRQEDAPRINDTLTLFNNHKHKLAEKDINKYPRLSDLSAAVEPYRDTPTTNKEAEKQTIAKGLDVLYKDNKYQVNKLKSKEASIALYSGGAHSGKRLGTDWCTATDSKYNMYDHYTQNGGSLHTIHVEGDKNSPYQFDDADQLMDRHDTPVDHINFVSEHPALTSTLIKLNARFADSPRELDQFIANNEITHRVFNKQLADHPALTHDHVTKLIDQVLSHPDKSRKYDLKAISGALPFETEHVDQILRHADRAWDVDREEHAAVVGHMADIPTSRYESHHIAHMLAHPSQAYKDAAFQLLGKPMSPKRAQYFMKELPAEQIHDTISRIHRKYDGFNGASMTSQSFIENATQHPDPSVIDRLIDHRWVKGYMDTLAQNPQLTKQQFETLISKAKPEEYTRHIIASPHFSSTHAERLVDDLATRVRHTKPEAISINDQSALLALESENKLTGEHMRKLTASAPAIARYMLMSGQAHKHPADFAQGIGDLFGRAVSTVPRHQISDLVSSAYHRGALDDFDTPTQAILSHAIKTPDLELRSGLRARAIQRSNDIDALHHVMNQSDEGMNTDLEKLTAAANKHYPHHLSRKYALENIGRLAFHGGAPALMARHHGDEDVLREYHKGLSLTK